MSKRIAVATLVVALSTVLAGCASPAFNNAIFAKANALQAAPAYRIGPGDQVTIRVLGQEDVTESLVQDIVRPDGKVSFPVHGDITAAGKTTAELRTELQEAFKKTLNMKKPRVYVAVNSFDSKSVTVLGEVIRPGRFPYHGQMRVADLLGLAIGPKDTFAAPNRALLFREVEGATKVYHVHLKDFFNKANFDTNFYIRPGDVVYVPKNGWAKVYNGVRKVFLPFSAIFDSIGLGGRSVSYFAPVP